MNHRSTIAIGLSLLAVCALCPSAESKRPLVLVFEATRGEGADKDLAAATTKAVRNYLRETQRVEATVLDRRSPTVLRAIMDKKLTADKIASYASQGERIEVARALSFQYAAGAEVAVKEIAVREVGANVLKVVPGEKNKPADTSGKAGPEKRGETPTRRMTVVEVRFWLARVDGGKNARWETARSSEVSGASPADLDNAVQSAASAAVIEASRQAFADLPRVSEPAASTGNESTAIRADQPAGASTPSAGSHAARAEESIKAGNLALAIAQYLRAVNADPTDTSVRLKLAEAYARKGMFREAEDELARAREAGADAETVADTKDRIDRMRSGEGEASPEQSRRAPAEPAKSDNRVSLNRDKPINGAPNAVARIVEGDKLWNSGKPDEAAEAYRESIKLNPSDWRAHERLAVVDASMSLFGEARKALDELARVQPNPPASVLANRHEMMRVYFDKHFEALIRQYETTGTDFEKGIITRESYYNAVKGLALRLESMASFLDTVVAPSAKKPAHLRRGLACGLMAQAASNLLDYLETNAAKSKSNAGIFANQAKSEMQAAAKLDENKVVVEKEPAVQPPPEQPSSEQPLAEQPASVEQPVQ